MNGACIRLEPSNHQLHLVFSNAMNILILRLHFIDLVFNTIFMTKVDIILHVRQLGETPRHHDILTRKQITGDLDKLLTEDFQQTRTIPFVNTITVSEEIIRFHTNITIRNKLFGIGALTRTSRTTNNNKLSHAYTPKTNK